MESITNVLLEGINQDTNLATILLCELYTKRIINTPPVEIETIWNDEKFREYFN